MTKRYAILSERCDVRLEELWPLSQNKLSVSSMDLSWRCTIVGSAVKACWRPSA